MNKLLIFFLVLCFGVIQSLAQESDKEKLGSDGLISFNYAISMPLGSTGDYISDPSFRGFNFDYRRKMSNNVTVGLMFGWTHFYEQKDRDVYSAPNLPGGSISAVQSRKISVTPITLQGHYHFLPKAKIDPYLGFSMGAYRIEYEKWWGDIQDRNDVWKFGVSGQAGVLVPITKDYLGLNFSLLYQWVPYEYAEVEGITYLSLNMGVYVNF